MASTRSYDFLTGPQTSTAPTPGTPTTDSDFVSKGYADDTYAKLTAWGDPVADTTALKAVAAADRSDMQARVKDDNKSIWVFDAASSATEDGTTVIQPTSGTGRWLIASGSSSGSSGSASNLEALQTQNALASIGYTTPKMDNSIRTNGLEIPAHVYSNSRLIENYTSGGSTIKVVHNPVVIFDSDKDYDSITNWAAVGAGTTLAATAGSTKVGSNHFSFNKDGSAVSASIRHTLAAQTLSVAANYRVYFWVDMPSVTGLSNIFLKIMGAATTDFSKWDLTTNSAGGALATGYNLMFVDIANTAASSTGGTAWTTTQLARYVEVGVTTSSSGQTYTGIKFAGLWFSQGDITAFGNKYLEYTGYDTSNKNDFIMASSNTTLDGIVTLSATVAQSYTAGIAAAAACKLSRSTLSWSQAGLIGFDTTLSSGTIALEQEIRATRLLRESLSGNYSAYVDMYNPQIYKVTVVGGSTIGVADSEVHTANLKNGNSIHIFKTTYSEGEPNFTLLATRSMTADATASSGTTTLTVDPTGIAVGDYVVKQNLSVSASVVSSTADENFVAMSYATSPNGAQLISPRNYPNANSVYAHWWMGGPSVTLALRDQTGQGRTLFNPSGTINTGDAFKGGKYSVSGMNTSNLLRTAGGTSAVYSANDELIQISLWYYHVTGASGTIACVFDGVSNGWVLTISSNKVELYTSQTSTTSDNIHPSTLANGSWNHIVMQVKSAVINSLYVNGVNNTVSAGNISAAGSALALTFGYRQSSGTLDSALDQPISSTAKLADCIVWRDGATLSLSDVNFLYNGGNPQFYGYNPVLLRNEYDVTGQSGQRISMKAKLNRTTSAVSPYILNAGIIKTA